MGPRRTRYTDALLTVIAVLLGILAIDGMGGVTSSAVASGPPGQSAKKIPGTGLVSAADQRKMIIAELKCVDYVTIFDEASPLGLIDRLKPGIYAKGGDYTIGTIDQNERRAVEGYGGEIAIVPGTDSHSTTGFIGEVTGTGSKE